MSNYLADIFSYNTASLYVNQPNVRKTIHVILELNYSLGL